MVRTLLDRCDYLITEKEDKEVEEQHIRRALTKCGYPSWTFTKIRKQMLIQKEDKKKSRKEVKDKNRGLIVIPYVKGVSEAISRVFKKHHISTAMKPHTMVRRMVIHPKD